MPTTALLWYRRDLRIADHRALTLALREFDRVVAVFVFDDALLHGRFASTPRTAFMLGCLRSLDEALRERGSGLVVRRGRPEQELVALAAEAGAQAVLWTSDVAPYARARDTRVTSALREAGVQARPQGGSYVVDVSTPRTRAGAPFAVFSPFHRHWLELERRTVHRAPTELPALPGAVRKGRLPAVEDLGLTGTVAARPGAMLAAPFCEPGEPAARAALRRWLDGPIDAYGDARDLLAEAGTSGLSPYLRWGCVSAVECEQRAARRGGDGARAWIRQLCWREFYAHVLLTHPDNAHLELQPRYRELEWVEDDDALEAWRAGRTGYPLVDAGMRQLARTGWMHNRARLVVGSFLTKDLHLDWRLGEAHFEALLLDGEPAQNNGNWQWVSSVGADPAPYFRILNPMLQQRRFDPDGVYVRRWVPELRCVPDERLVEPWTMSDAEQAAAGCAIGRDYPAPIVEHAQERRRALQRYGATAG
ncbi:MAG: deoxyribodipyrimidine photo-lyase [Solirubrobacteraceae bacterium]|jgi:deoxyribodipyrimidine photo-lyase|nr:deoxyribodipyrimidine photo-lyase [Solirubrobacteraceae bacterium]